jgi:hypothetical protein
MLTRQLNKLDALRILSNAYWYVRDIYGNDSAASSFLDWRFNAVRRSLNIKDLQSETVANEGFNGKMPTYF